MNNDYENFREIIKKIITEEIEKKLQKDNLYISHTGTVTNITKTGVITGTTNTDPFKQACTIDLIYTTIENTINKSGEVLSVGNTVTVMEKYNSNLSNCYIAIKNGINS